MTMRMFLTPDEVIELTGCVWASKQIAQLRRMGKPFDVNARGKPMVTVAAVEGRKAEPKPKQWEMPE